MLLTPAYPEVAPRALSDQQEHLLTRRTLTRLSKTSKWKLMLIMMRLSLMIQSPGLGPISPAAQATGILLSLQGFAFENTENINNNGYILLFNHRLADTIGERVKRVVEAGLFVDEIDGSRWHLVLLLRRFFIAEGRILIILYLHWSEIAFLGHGASDGEGKPTPHIFLTLASHLGVVAGGWVMVGGRGRVLVLPPFRGPILLLFIGGWELGGEGAAANINHLRRESKGLYLPRGYVIMSKASIFALNCPIRKIKPG